MVWRISLRDVALEGLPGIAGGGAPVTGRLSADPDCLGHIGPAGAGGYGEPGGRHRRGARLGGGRLVIAPMGEAGVTVKGNLFGRFDLEMEAIFAGKGPRVTGKVCSTALPSRNCSRSWRRSGRPWPRQRSDLRRAAPGHAARYRGPG